LLVATVPRPCPCAVACCWDSPGSLASSLRVGVGVLLTGSDVCGWVDAPQHSAITAYNGLQTLLDTNLQENVLQGVTDNHFWTASVLSGYFVYDTIISFTNLAAEDDAAGAIQTLVHHLFVLGTLPVGLYTNTWGWIGSGVLAVRLPPSQPAVCVFHLSVCLVCSPRTANVPATPRQSALLLYP
jgi:hypothetical protein